jgi:hypothetical protein
MAYSHAAARAARGGGLTASKTDTPPRAGGPDGVSLELRQILRDPSLASVTGTPW